MSLSNRSGKITCIIILNGYNENCAQFWGQQALVSPYCFKNLKRSVKFVKTYYLNDDNSVLCMFLSCLHC